jgi:hypothetical protein
LFKCALLVIGRNRKLLLFPVLISLLMCVIGLSFIAPIALWHTGYAYTDAAHWKAVADRWFIWDAGGKHAAVNHAGYVLLAALYLLSTFLATFFNVAFYSQILNALRGRPVSVSGGLRLAATRVNAILAWSLFTGLVGLMIRGLEERVGLVGRWIVGFIGLAWSVASVFVVPIIVMETEGANPVHFLKTSAAMLRKTWGESLLGYLGIRIGGLLALAGSLVLFVVLIVLGGVFENYLILGIVSVIWFVSLVAFLYLLNVAGNVYQGALYVYAAEGAVPAPFDQDQMNRAWKFK